LVYIESFYTYARIHLFACNKDARLSLSLYPSFLLILQRQIPVVENQKKTYPYVITK
jgi:hypothetical protein